MKDHEVIDHDATDEIVCPYCGYEKSNSWELSAGTLDCNECGMLFACFTETTTIYSTERDCKLNNEEHDWYKDVPDSTCFQCHKCEAMKFH